MPAVMADDARWQFWNLVDEWTQVEVPPGDPGDEVITPFRQFVQGTRSATLTGFRRVDEYYVSVALICQEDWDFIQLFGLYAVQYLLENRPELYRSR